MSADGWVDPMLAYLGTRYLQLNLGDGFIPAGIETNSYELLPIHSV